MTKILVSLSILLFSWNSFGQPTSPPERSPTTSTKNTRSTPSTTVQTKTTTQSEANNNPTSPPTRPGSPTSPYVTRVKLRGRLTEEEEREQEEELENKKNRQRNKDSASKDNLSINKIDSNYTFSGADCDVYAYRGGDTNGLKRLESIATVSISIYEAKAPVRRLGHASAVGFSGNIRSIAGSIICYLGDNHPLEKISKQMSKHKDDIGNEFVSGRIHPFNMLLLYKNEVGKDYQVLIKNIEIISEGLVTSVNDIATEMVFQFVATEADLIS